MLLVDLDRVPADHRSDMEQTNRELIALAAKRRDKIDLLDEPFRRSKLAWKVAVLSNAVLYRLIALAEGTALSWNHANYLSAILNGRALVETIAFYWHFHRDYQRFSNAGDFASVDTSVTQALFATRDEELLFKFPEMKARQILNSIDAVEKEVQGIRGHYERLSEFCHPNSYGHRGLFAAVDQETGITTFQSREGDSFIHPIKCALGASGLFEIAFDAVANSLPSFAAAHHAASPSPIAR